MTRFILQFVSVVSSIQREAVSLQLTHYFLFLRKMILVSFWFFMKAVSSLKNVFLKCEHGVEFQPLSNILPQTFLTSNPGPILCKSVEIVKDLGVTINYDLSWGKHVSCIVNKANKVLGVIKRSLGKDFRHAFPCLFKSLVRPILEYAAPVWSPYQKRTD